MSFIKLAILGFLLYAAEGRRTHHNLLEDVIDKILEDEIRNELNDPGVVIDKSNKNFKMCWAANINCEHCSKCGPNKSGGWCVKDLVNQPGPQCICNYGWTGKNAQYIPDTDATYHATGWGRNRIRADWCGVPCHYTYDVKNKTCVDHCYLNPKDIKCFCQEYPSDPKCYCVLDPNGLDCICKKNPNQPKCYCHLDPKGLPCFCQNNPSDPKCYCLLDPNGDDCFCQKNPSHSRCICHLDPNSLPCFCQNNPSDPKCYCLLDPNGNDCLCQKNPNDPKCVCHLDPNSLKCYCQKNPDDKVKCPCGVIGNCKGCHDDCGKYNGRCMEISPGNEQCVCCRGWAGPNKVWNNQFGSYVADYCNKECQWIGKENPSCKKRPDKVKPCNPKCNEANNGKCLPNGRCECCRDWTGPNAEYNTANEPKVLADYCDVYCPFTKDTHRKDLCIEPDYIERRRNAGHNI